ncbi:transglutaminase domain-containing protein [Paenibacillus sp. J2TS4]|uniref:transglutaminase family protein n=1 Tax=Paenibacillus sp. J2TS4 TaxID=2807194 RepID=UPI001B21F728|nr:transglutaminase domain-containing protein [Paenibacillus sp. J2TS4]GIP34595.1 hypothetical protein J2TS4_38050 [Paenibacillus sp. J2TS4]
MTNLSLPTPTASTGIPGPDRKGFPPLAGSSLTQWMTDAVSTLLLFVLLREWLAPLPQIPGVSLLSSSTPFVIGIAGYLILDLLRLPAVLTWAMKLGIALAWVGLLYYSALFPLGGWLPAYGGVLMDDLIALWDGRWPSISGPSRTLWLFISLALLAEAVQSLLLVKKRILWLVAATAVYLLALDAWFHVAAEAALLRTMAVGLTLAAANRIPRLKQQYAAVGAGKGWLTRWSAGSALLIAACLLSGTVGASLGGPVSEAWKLPQYRQAAERFITDRLSGLAASAPQEAAGIRWAEAAARTGYSLGDAALGGPVVPDEGSFFVALTDEPTYWRGETRDTYDGRGWSLSGEPSTISPEAGQALAPRDDASDAEEAHPRVITQRVLFRDTSPGNLIFAGGTVLAVEQLTAADGSALPAERAAYRPLSDAVVAAEGKQRLRSYTVKVALPENRPERLSAAGPPDLREVGEQYVQLPESLPQRVIDLAEQLTKDAGSDYERAKAIELFLQENFQYSMEAAAPSQDEDFVDSFLFGHQTGYCDYFSTSMVVLLRAAGVPARWVKGFAPGEIRLTDEDTVLAAYPRPKNNGESSVIETVTSSRTFAGPPTSSYVAAADSDNEARHNEEWAEAAAAEAEPDEARTNLRYEATVRNLHAHSWPEVFFPGYGWVPFEPTPGYGSSSDGIGVNVSPGLGPSDTESGKAEQGSSDTSNQVAAGVNTTGSENGAATAHQSSEGRKGQEQGQGLSLLTSWLDNRMEEVRRVIGARPPASPVIWLGAALAAAVVISLTYFFRPSIRRSRSVRPALQMTGRGCSHQLKLIRSMDKIWMMLYRITGPKPANLTFREYTRSLHIADESTARLMAEWAKLYENVCYGRKDGAFPSDADISSFRRRFQIAIDHKEISPLRR